MRNKIFLAFIAVIITALVSGYIFKWLMSRDFNDYVGTMQNQHIYWVVASLEESHKDGEWDNSVMFEAVHWATMLGFDIQVLDASGGIIMDSGQVYDMLPHAMRHRMMDMLEHNKATGQYLLYPLTIGGVQFGTVKIRPAQGYVAIKEELFKKHGAYFMLVSLGVAGGGSVLLAFLFTRLLINPVKRLREASDKIAKGDLKVRCAAGSNDEVGALAASFNQMAAALEREDLLRKHVMTNITHELRTPLTIMKANVEAVIDGVINTPAEALRNINQGIDRLTGLVKGIEDMVKAEENVLRKCHYEAIVLSGFISSLAEPFLQAAAQKGLSIIVDISDSLRVTTDREKLETILINLISNAVKFTMSGGVAITGAQEDDGFSISIKDSGLGITAEEQALIFGRFYKKGAASGMGIGLSIVKELVSVLNGTITVESEVGKGSIFTVRFISTKTILL
ncbi:sensor histidine kinase [Candidatus Magnetominusculus xianensis]|uniref:histidine kinase n=1 Tax=Candidatus Magnetominusculus xianensis TaxID=1748249 RepID=A0ABR5SH80_9BACT|nr:HAMP domain-containing sensor histidine kinase [Candidatus Magnetominusculus xianensis]KWT91046.1 two-component system sensor histidine kinase [Candidatus Magnetominusculus xianensis]MBF0402561.1 HAMP domain-containing histidine kinase [Nitrospirota bacterium]